MSPIGMYGYGYGNGYGSVYSAAGVNAQSEVAGSAYAADTGRTTQESEAAGSVVNPGESSQVQPGRKSSPAECQTCKNRKYQDGSNEADVSFKTPQHVSPTSAGSAVRAHEAQHVSNAYQKAGKDGGKVLQASVAIKTAVCPECGRTYVAGGTTTTKISYSNEENPYVKNMKSRDSGLLSGMNFDAAG